MDVLSDPGRVRRVGTGVLTVDAGAKLEERSQRSPSGCLEWIRGRDWDGYGILWVAGRTRRAHRVAWELANGRAVRGWSYGIAVTTPGASSPRTSSSARSPTTTVTVSCAAGRMTGAASVAPTAKLTWPAVREIRRRLALGQSHASLGALFGVRRETISLIARGERWKENQAA